MVGLANSVQYVWALSVGFECALLILMLARQHYRTYPAFFFYVVADILQSPVLFIVYAIWGFLSYPASHIAWASQAVIICARALAVAELCRHLLQQFSGIWALARRLLTICAAGVAVYSVLTAGWQWGMTVLKINQGLELTMVVVIVILFAFARYYEIMAERAQRTMGVGFFALSCFKVVNDTILQHRLAQYANVWRVLGMMAFLTSLSLWFSALYKLAPAPTRKTPLLAPDIYGSLTPKINERLRELNEQLKRFWHSKAQQY